MKRKLIALVLVGGIAFGGLGGFDGGPQAAQAQATLPPDGEVDPVWKQVFKDDFNGEHLYEEKDLRKKGATNVKWTNASPNNAWGGKKSMENCVNVDGGVLRVKSQPKWDPTAPADQPRWNCRITTVEKFGGGRPLIFAASVKFHSGTGHRSAFWWNLPTGGPSEIDIYENEGFKEAGECRSEGGMGVNQSANYGLNHTFYSKYEPKVGYKYCLPTKADVKKLLNDQFHTVHAVLIPNVSVQFYIDGVNTATFNQNDGSGHAYATASDVEAILTNSGEEGAGGFDVDWVRVWKMKKEVTPTPPTVCDNDCYRTELGPYVGYYYRENTNPSSPLQARIIFDKKFYVDTYPDVRTWAEGKVATQGGNIYDHAQWHWLNYGIQQGRQGSATFDPVYYMNTHPDVNLAYGWNNYDGAIRHYVENGRFEGRRASVFFDASFYKARYGDVAGFSNVAVVDHFTNFGMDEGRQGSAQFGPAYYMGTNPDVKAAFSKNYRKGMSHWLSNGRAEGRPGVP